MTQDQPEKVEPDHDGPLTIQERILVDALNRSTREKKALQRENDDLKDMMRGVSRQLAEMAGIPAADKPAPPTSPLWREGAKNRWTEPLDPRLPSSTTLDPAAGLPARNPTKRD